MDEIKAGLAEEIANLPEDDPLQVAVTEDSKALGKVFKALTKQLMREQIVKDGVRGGWPQT